jgi:hypothetical protein
MTLNFEGFIKDVQYKAFLAEDLRQYDYKSFDVNEVETYYDKAVKNAHPLQVSKSNKKLIIQISSNTL